MADPITPISSLGTQPAVVDTRAPNQNQLDKDAFLKLLVAQLKYQDPMNPADPQAFLAQSAQFTTVEKLEEIAKQGAQAAQAQGLATAGALIGRNVRWLAADGTPIAGKVDGAMPSPDGLRLKVGADTIGFEQVIEVGKA